MKTIYSTVLLFFISCCAVQSQNLKKQVYGTYICTNTNGGSPWALHINNKKFQMLEIKKYKTPSFTFNDTIAIGKTKYESKNMIKLTSDNIYSKVIKSAKHDEYYDKNLKDTIKLRFRLNLTSWFNINMLCIYDGDLLILSLKQGLDSLCIPSSYNGGYYAMQFEICWNTESPGFWGQQLGFSVFTFGMDGESFKLKDKKNNVIEISVPELTDDVFFRFYIDNEYCKVSPNSITWRDKVFRKISDEIIDLETLKKRYD